MHCDCGDEEVVVYDGQWVCWPDGDDGACAKDCNFCPTCGMRLLSLTATEKQAAEAVARFFVALHWARQADIARASMERSDRARVEGQWMAAMRSFSSAYAKTPDSFTLLFPTGEK